jgi:hypothetical protein
MSQPEQWRFQWPDGTWIRWNPQTQSWEKEPAGADADADVQEAEPSPPETVEGPDPEPIAELLPEPDPEPEPATEDALDDELVDDLPSRRSRRSMVGDVLPPSGEPERPGGSLWPTVLTGIVVGLGVGLLLWSMIR